MDDGISLKCRKWIAKFRSLSTITIMTDFKEANCTYLYVLSSMHYVFSKDSIGLVHARASSTTTRCMFRSHGLFISEVVRLCLQIRHVFPGRRSFCDGLAGQKVYNNRTSYANLGILCQVAFFLVD